MGVAGVGAGTIFGGARKYQPNGAPSLLSLTVDSDTAITLNWTIGSTNHDGHRIYISTDNITFTENSTVLGAVATKQVTGLTAGTLYYFYVVAYKGTIESTASNTVSTTTWTAGEAVIRTSGTVGWYDFNDLTTITKDGSDFVSLWKDKLLSGNDLEQAKGAKQPLWQNDGILFDGVDDCLRKAFVGFVQPESIYLVISQITWVLNRRIMDGFTLGSGEIRQATATPRIYAYAPNVSPVNDNLGLNTFGVVKLVFNGANSKLKINDVEVTWNAGTNNMGGITLGAHGGLGQPANIKVKELIIRNVADTTANENLIFNYLKAKYTL